MKKQFRERNVKKQPTGTENEKCPLTFGSKAAIAGLGVFLVAFLALIMVFRLDHGGIKEPHGLQVAGKDEAPLQPSSSPGPTVQHALVTTQPVNTEGILVGNPPQPMYSFTLSIAGRAAFESDVTLATENDPDYHFEDVFGRIAPYIHADHNLIFLDNLISDNEHNYTDFSAPQGCLRAIKAAGFDTVVLGNESVLDKELSGLDVTRNAIESEGLNYAGVLNETGKRVRYINLNGANIAVLSYSDKLNKTTKQLLETEGEQFREYDPAAAREEILEARDSGAMFIIVFMHWGADDAATPTDQQRQEAMELCSYGADLIIGTRTQNPVAPEYVIAEDCLGTGRNTAMVAWSLGSVITENRENRNRISSYMLNLDIACSYDTVTFKSVGYVPLYIWKHTVGEVNRFYTVCSSADAPAEMNEKQSEYMEHGLQYVRQLMENAPVRADQ